jgi:hypothetical protein
VPTEQTPVQFEEGDANTEDQMSDFSDFSPDHVENQDPSSAKTLQTLTQPETQPSQEQEQESDASVDNIELTVSTIQTETLQVMKEKPVVSLIK